jgi:F-type H+-transporting ATPase subunit b
MATKSHTEAPSGAKPAFPPFAKETFASQLVWLAITFVALYLMISRIAVPRIGGIIDERQKRIEGDFAAAQRMKDESEAALAAYEKSLADARNRAQSIGAEVRDKLNAEADVNRKATEARLNAQLADAEKQIAATKSSAMTNVRGIAVDAAAANVERHTRTAPSPPPVASPRDEAHKARSERTN